MNKRFDFLQMLKDGHRECSDSQYDGLTKGEYLSECIFGFENYASEDAELFAARAVDVARALNSDFKVLYEYTEDPGRLLWYLIMVNMPFFKPKFSFGTTVRGGMWGGDAARPNGLLDTTRYNLNCTGLYIGHSHFNENPVLTENEWRDFINAICEFYYERT